MKFKIGDLVEWKDPHTKTAPPRLGLIMKEHAYSNGKVLYSLVSSEFKRPWGAWIEEITLVSGEER